MNFTHGREDESWVTASQTAALLPHVSVRTVQRWAEQGRIPAERLPGGTYRIRREDIAHLIGERAS